MDQNRKPPEIPIGLFQQLRSLVNARSNNERRTRAMLSGPAVQPIEVCETRAMLAAADLAFANDVDVSFSSVTEVDFDSQVQNAQRFVDLHADGGEVSVLVNGDEFDLADLLNGNVGSAIRFPVDQEDLASADISHVPPTTIPITTVDRIDDHLPQVDTAEFPLADLDKPAVETIDGGVNVDSSEVDHIDADANQSSGIEPSETPKPSGERPLTVDVDQEPQSEDQPPEDVDPPPTTGAADATGQQFDVVPTTVTTVIKTDSGILVLHQTSEVSEAVATNSPNFSVFQQLIQRFSAELRDSRTKQDNRPEDPVVLGERPIAVVALDSVFANSGGLFDRLQIEHDPRDLAVVAVGSPVDPPSQLVGKKKPAEAEATAEVPIRFPSTTSPWKNLTERLFDEFVSRRRFAENLAFAERSTSNQLQLNDISQRGDVQLSRHVLVSQLAWSPASSEDEQTESLVNVDSARQLAQPSEGSSNVRNSDLSRSLNFLTALTGESSLTIPRRLPEHPPEMPEVMCQATALLYSINPRGPPSSDLIEEFSWPDAIQQQHEMLKHSIAPRSPSIRFFA